MKISLSRKGFDAANGGCASPVLPDGQLVSLPIPAESSLHFDDVLCRDETCAEIWRQLAPKSYRPGAGCHLDPDLRPEARAVRPRGWTAALGQTGAAETHLRQQGFGIGDVFLFFGWFRRTERADGALRYVRGAPDLQVIWGYLQVGAVLTGQQIRARCPWHPHAEGALMAESGNTLYLAAEQLTLDGTPTGMPGFGTLPFAEKRVLTAPGKSRSRWKLTDFLAKSDISCHGKKNIHGDYFQSNCIGQEFVIAESAQNALWLKELLTP